jgi:hypothetical protein
VTVGDEPPFGLKIMRDTLKELLELYQTVGGTPESLQTYIQKREIAEKDKEFLTGLRVKWEEA